MKAACSSPFVLGMLVVLLFGCAGARTTVEKAQQTYRPAQPPVARVQASYMPSIYNLAQGLAAQLNRNYRDGGLSSCTCIITTFVDINDLYRSSAFGRLLAEAMGAEIFRLGGRVLDIRQARCIMARPGTGELILSREAEELGQEVSAGAALVGTYGAGQATVAVTVKLIDLKTREVLSVAMTEIARTSAVNTLLSSSLAPEPTAYDRPWSVASER